MIWYRYKDELLLPFVDHKEAIRYACTNQFDLVYFQRIQTPCNESPTMSPIFRTGIISLQQWTHFTKRTFNARP